MTRFAALLLCVTFLLAPASANSQLAPQLFEDFSYADKTELRNHGWIVRTEAGWPGIPGPISCRRMLGGSLLSAIQV